MSPLHTTLNNKTNMKQEEFNTLMASYESDNFSILYQIGVTLIRVLTVSMLTYLVVTTL